MGDDRPGRRPAPGSRPVAVTPTEIPADLVEGSHAPADLVEVLPDVSGLDRAFHYRVPEALADRATRIGAVVRVPLHGRKVRGWVIGAGTPPPPGVEAQQVLAVVSLGPPPDVVELARWAAHRFAGRLRPLLLAASPSTIVRALPAVPSTPLVPAVPSTPLSPAVAATPEVPAKPAAQEAPAKLAAQDAPAKPAAEEAEAGPSLRDAVRRALEGGDTVLRLPPTFARQPLVEEVVAACDGRVLVLVESHDDAQTLAGRLRRRGWSVAHLPDEWAAAAAGARVVVGTRNAVFAPGVYAVIVVLDAHSESYRAERVPTFDARAVATERAARCGIPVCFVSACPPVELLHDRNLVTLERSAERRGWGRIVTLDRRDEDPREGGYPSRLATLVRQAVEAEPSRQVLCVLNRIGRARLLSCGSCRSVQRCGRCGSAQVMPERPGPGAIGRLLCPRCGDDQQAICPACGTARLRILRPGVARAREQLEALLGLEVGEVSGPRTTVPATPVVVGTEAVLHRVRVASMVGFLDFDQELLAPRFRGAEQALVLLARAVRATAPTGGPVVVRTSLPDHEVVRSAQAGDPGILAAEELRRRAVLRFPPYSALATITGPPEALAEAVADLPASLERWGTEGGTVVRAPDATTLADALGCLVTDRTAGWADLPVRVEVEPVGL